MAIVAQVSTVLAQSQAPAAPAVGGGQLVLAALLGIAAVVLLITWLQVHPFLALIAGSAVVGLVGGSVRRRRSRASPPAREARSVASAYSWPSAR
jgi:hypothetical protein